MPNKVEVLSIDGDLTDPVKVVELKVTGLENGVVREVLGNAFRALPMIPFGEKQAAKFFFHVEPGLSLGTENMIVAVFLEAYVNEHPQLRGKNPETWFARGDD
jgi:hypothetical protein